MNKKIIIPFNAPLNKEDSEIQTYGCRATCPDICANNELENVCAFVTSDFICHKPSKAWKKQYLKLKKGTQK